MSIEQKFDIDAQREFDQFFPPAKIQAFEEEGLDDWVDIFEALEYFGEFPRVNEDDKAKVTQLFLSDKNASEIRVKKTDQGLRVYRRNIAPLLRVSLSPSLFLSSFAYFTNESLATLEKHLSGQASDPEQDWQR